MARLKSKCESRSTCAAFLGAAIANVRQLAFDKLLSRLPVFSPYRNAPVGKAEELSRTFSTLDGLGIAIGCTIGVGIFIVPGEIAAKVQDPSFVLLLWLVGGCICLAGALSIAELSSALPDAGGLYTFLRRAYGDDVAFLFGWTTLIVINPSITAAMAASIGFHLSDHVRLAGWSANSVSIGCLLLIAILNLFSLSISRSVQAISSLAKIAGLVLLAIMLLGAGQSNATSWSSSGAYSVPGLWGALVAVIWAFDGWAYVTFSSEELKNSTRAMPVSLIGGVVIAAAIYLLINMAYLSVLTPSEMSAAESIPALAVSKSLGANAGGMVSALIVLALFGSMNAMFLTATRMPVGMKRNVRLLEGVGAIHRRFKTPANSVVLHLICSTAYLLVGGFYQLLSMTVAVSWIFYALIVLAVIILRVREPSLLRPFVVPFYPAVPLVFCVMAIGIAIAAFVGEPVHSSLGLLIAVCGWPVISLMKRRQTMRATK